MKTYSVLEIEEDIKQLEGLSVNLADFINANIKDSPLAGREICFFFKYSDYFDMRVYAIGNQARQTVFGNRMNKFLSHSILPKVEYDGELTHAYTLLGKLEGGKLEFVTGTETYAEIQLINQPPEVTDKYNEYVLVNLRDKLVGLIKKA